MKRNTIKPLAHFPHLQRESNHAWVFSGREIRLDPPECALRVIDSLAKVPGQCWEALPLFVGKGEKRLSALVRFFAHGPLITLPVNPASGRYTTDSVSLLSRYLAREAITASTGAAQSTAAALTENSATRVISVEVQPGKIVAIEINPPGRSTSADTSSPRISGNAQLEGGPGWLYSVIEIATE